MIDSTEKREVNNKKVEEESEVNNKKEWINNTEKKEDDYKKVEEESKDKREDYDKKLSRKNRKKKFS